MEINAIKKQIESVLFVSTKPMAKKRIAALLNKNNQEKISDEDLEAAFLELEKDYRLEEKGIVLNKIDDSYQLVSSPQNSEIIKDLTKDEFSGDLSAPSLETLAIIAYKGPISKPMIDHIRGVNCSLILRNLLIRGLIAEVPGMDKDILYYEISFDFLRYLGLNKKEDLPDFDRLFNLDVFAKLAGGAEEKSQITNPNVQ